MKIMCVTGLVDGITVGKIYEIKEVIVREDGVYVSVIDNYGIASIYKYNRFVKVNEKDKLEYTGSYNDILFSISL